MIGKITGRVDYVAEDHALIEAGGVGYVVTCARRTLMGLRRGEWAALYTEFLVREDAMQLFGFETLAEREWHRLLTSVQGVGAKVALAVLGSLGPDAVGRAIALGDAASIRQAPGVGPKLAQRIVLELKEKAPAVMALGAAAARPAEVHAGPPAAATPAAPAAPAPAPAPDAAEDRARARADALSALTHLGYGDGEAAAAVARAATLDAEADAAALIRAALKALAPGA
jgi:Holliday junction DNA helicase RuvA